MTTALTIGERSRFPTPRELFGAALGRFLINPELRPERSLLVNLSAAIAPSDRWLLDAAIWLNDSDDTLAQRRVVVDGVSRRQRYNTEGSETFGAELAATLFLSDRLRAEFSAALQDGRMRRDEDGVQPPLLQRPKRQFRVALDWQASDAVDVRAEVMHTGSALDLADDGSPARLPDSTSVNLRGFLRVAEWHGHDVHLTASVDNLTDELILPQLGLPAPGRLLRVGVRID